MWTRTEVTGVSVREAGRVLSASWMLMSARAHPASMPSPAATSWVTTSATVSQAGQARTATSVSNMT